MRAKDFTSGITLLGVVAAAAVGGSVGRASVGSVSEEPFAEWAELERNRSSLTRGPADAPAVHIFTDYECPACAALEREAGERWRALAGAGRLRIVVHDAPLAAHHKGAIAAAAMHCVAGEEKWVAHAALYAKSSEWKESSEPAHAIAGIVSAATGRDGSAELQLCMADVSTERSVAAARQRARALSVHEVPIVIAAGMRLRATGWRALARFVERRVARS